MPSTLLHNYLAVHQLLVGTIVIDTVLARWQKSWAPETDMYGFELDVCHLPVDVTLSLDILKFKTVP